MNTLLYFYDSFYGIIEKNMDYYELKFTYTSELPTEIINDVLSAELGEIGFESFETHDAGLLAYVPVSAYNREAIEEKLKAFPLEDVRFSYSSEPIVSKDWNEEWEKNYFQPIRIGKECIIRASFHPDESGFRHTILIDPKMAFGTGNHDTTRLMITELLQTPFSGERVLDMGCGTAVLAILARKLGAGETVAIDIDEWAYDNAKENIELNDVDGIDVRQGGAEQIRSGEQFDLILANINRNILLNDMAAYAAAMKNGARLFLSGFYMEDIPLLEAEAVKNGLQLLKTRSSNNWAMMVCSRVV